MSDIAAADLKMMENADEKGRRFPAFANLGKPEPVFCFLSKNWLLSA
ncbi:MAG: hypothetical protein LUI87_13960 [Lachnospiraceae bacterium]|nr:hypothetical protein [Lachnospiraceae bacterium]